MNMLFGTKLDLTNVAPAGEYTPVPEGIYSVICIEFDVVDGDKGKGCKCKFQITEGEHANRKFGNYIIIGHTNAKAQDIGQRLLRSWCDALGVSPALESAEPLMHRVLKAKVKIEAGRTDPKTDKTYGPQNRIETFFPADSAPAAAPAAVSISRPAVAASPALAVAAAPATAAAAPSKAMPWKR